LGEKLPKNLVLFKPPPLYTQIQYFGSFWNPPPPPIKNTQIKSAFFWRLPFVKQFFDANGSKIFRFKSAIFNRPVVARSVLQLDGVGPYDNRPSTNQLHHFVKKERKKVTCDMWHVTHDMWHVTHDTGHMTCDMLWGNHRPTSLYLFQTGCFRLEQQHLAQKLRVFVCSELLWALELYKTVFPFQLPSSSGLWFMIFWRLGGKG
jgi:hypothetical protein